MRVKFFALPAVLEQGYFKGYGLTLEDKYGQMRYAFGAQLDASRIMPLETPNITVLWPMVEEIGGEAQIVGAIRILPAIDSVTILNQFELNASGELPKHKLMRETTRDTLGGETDVGLHPLTIFYQPTQTFGSFTITHKFSLLEDDPSIIGEQGLSAVTGASGLQAALNRLKNLSPRLATFRPEFWLVNR